VQDARASFPPHLASVTEARQFLRARLDAWGAADHEWAASQVLTELATNSVLHARTDFDVEITYDGELLRICVADGSPRLPVQRGYSPEATTGRGISVVEAIAQSWGYETRADGKTVWCVIVAHDSAQAGDLDIDAFLLDADADLVELENGKAPTACLRSAA
jgi:anti-sigma regulatory factor (Ser/Thr protein kinase)